MGGYLESNSSSDFLLPLYSGSEVWEGIWNQTHFIGIEFLSHEITPRTPIKKCGHFSQFSKNFEQPYLKKPDFFFHKF